MSRSAGAAPPSKRAFNSSGLISAYGSTALSLRQKGVFLLPLPHRGVTKTRQPELHRYWTTRDQDANRRLFRLVAEILLAIDAGVFHPNPGWHGQGCPVLSRCWVWS